MAPATSRPVHVRLWAAARAAAGQAETTVAVSSDAGDPTVADVRRAVLAGELPAPLAADRLLAAYDSAVPGASTH